MLNVKSLWHSIRTNKKLKAFLITGLVFGAILFLLKSCKPESAQPDIPKKIPLVSTQFIQRNQFQPVFSVIGQVKVDQLTPLSAKASGQVESILVQQGMNFSPMQPLVQLSRSEFERTLEQSERQYDQQISLIEQEKGQHNANLELLKQDQKLLDIAEKSVKRYQDLVRRKLANEAQLDQAKEAAVRQASQVLQRQTSINNWPQRLNQLNAQADQFLAQLEQNKENADSLNLSAPFSGEVAEVLTAIGANITPLTPLMHVYAYDDKHLEANIPSKYQQLVEEALESKKPIKAFVTINSRPVELTLSHLKQSHMVQGARKGFFKPNDPKQLPLNSSFSLEVELPAIDHVYAVEHSAIHQNEYVYLVNQDSSRLERQNIEFISHTRVDNDKKLSLIRLPDLTNADKTLQIVTNQMVSDVNGMLVDVDQTQE